MSESTVGRYDSSPDTRADTEEGPLLTGSDGSVQVTGADGATAASATNPVPITPRRGTLTDRSGTITSGGSSQTLAAANTSRNYFFFQNLSSEDLYINFTDAATVDDDSIKVASGGSFVMEDAFVSTEIITVIGATTGSKFVAKEG